MPRIHQTSIIVLRDFAIVSQVGRVPYVIVQPRVIHPVKTVERAIVGSVIALLDGKKPLIVVARISSIQIKIVPELCQKTNFGKE